jgi:hypothetical protein
MDYGFPERRRTKRDKKAKVRYNRFKKGGRFRATTININEKEKGF